MVAVESSNKAEGYKIVPAKRSITIEISNAHGWRELWMGASTEGVGGVVHHWLVFCG